VEGLYELYVPLILFCPMASVGKPKCLVKPNEISCSGLSLDLILDLALTRRFAVSAQALLPNVQQLLGLY
jgi:hypothetical protein